jgi:hypothetical protein
VPAVVGASTSIGWTNEYARLHEPRRWGIVPVMTVSLLAFRTVNVLPARSVLDIR